MLWSIREGRFAGRRYFRRAQHALGRPAFELPSLPEGKAWYVFANTGVTLPDIHDIGAEPFDWTEVAHTRPAPRRPVGTPTCFFCALVQPAF